MFCRKSTFNFQDDHIPILQVLNVRVHGFVCLRCPIAHVDSFVSPHIPTAQSKILWPGYPTDSQNTEHVESRRRTFAIFNVNSNT